MIKKLKVYNFRRTPIDEFARIFISIVFPYEFKFDYLVKNLCIPYLDENGNLVWHNIVNNVMLANSMRRYFEVETFTTEQLKKYKCASNFIAKQLDKNKYLVISNGYITTSVLPYKSILIFGYDDGKAEILSYKNHSMRDIDFYNNFIKLKTNLYTVMTLKPKKFKNDILDLNPRYKTFAENILGISCNCKEKGIGINSILTELLNKYQKVPDENTVRYVVNALKQIGVYYKIIQILWNNSLIPENVINDAIQMFDNFEKNTNAIILFMWKSVFDKQKTYHGQIVDLFEKSQQINMDLNSCIEFQ